VTELRGGVAAAGLEVRRVLCADVAQGEALFF
jgi:hypothetical protein